VDHKGSVSYHETDFYSLEIPHYHDLNFSISLSVDAGNPDLYVMLCNEKSACVLTDDQMANSKVYPEVSASEHISSKDIVQIVHKKEQCSGTTLC
jgi:hypothetical protein